VAQWPVQSSFQLNYALHALFFKLELYGLSCLLRTGKLKSPRRKKPSLKASQNKSASLISTISSPVINPAGEQVQQKKKHPPEEEQMVI